MVDTKKINKVMRAIKSVAKQSTKVVGASLPLGSVIVNAVGSHQRHPTRPELAFAEFISRFNGVNPVTGKFELARAMQGAGGLILSGVAGWVITQLA